METTITAAHVNRDALSSKPKQTKKNCLKFPKVFLITHPQKLNGSLQGDRSGTLVKFFGGPALMSKLPNQDNPYARMQLLCLALCLFVSYISVRVAKRFKKPENHYVHR